MQTFSGLQENLNKDFSNFTIIKIVLPSNTAIRFLFQAMRGTCYKRPLDLQIWEAGISRTGRPEFDPLRGVCEFNAEIAGVFPDACHLPANYNQLTPNLYGSLAERQEELVSNMSTPFNEPVKVKIIHYNYARTKDPVFGNNACKIQLYESMICTNKQANYSCGDLSAFQIQSGNTAFFQTSVINTGMVLVVPILPEFAAKNN
jgi:hypothetical protein